jgi:hypothetical protein
MVIRAAMEERRHRHPTLVESHQMMQLRVGN